MTIVPSRQLQPPIYPFDARILVPTKTVTLRNGTSVFMIDAGTEDIMRIEFVFRAGMAREDLPLLATSSNMMLTEGSEKYTSEELNNIIDYYGIFLNLTAEKDTAGLVVYFLNKHFEKALELPVSEPGVHTFIECFVSGTADIYDIYKISVRPNHSLILKATPVLWNGADKRGKVHWDFLNRSFKRMKDGQSSLSETSSFMVKVFHPQVRSGNKPAIFYLLVKIEGDVSLIYSLQTEVKEGR